MKTKISTLFLTLTVMIGFSTKAQTSFYDLKSKTIDGKDFSFADLKGKKVLVVNTASKCGFTPQYEDLEKLYKTYKDKNFVIIGFPADNFAMGGVTFDRLVDYFLPQLSSGSSGHANERMARVLPQRELPV